MKVRDAIAEPLLAYHAVPKAQLKDTVEELLRTVDLSPEYGKKYPFQLSGGEGRRVTIARSLALRPRLVICDEPTSGLDVSVSAKILNVMKEIHDQYGLAYIWISHNLHVINFISQRMIVMYLGKIVEMGKTSEIFNNPAHPYTRALLLALPRFVEDPDSAERKTHLKGEVPSPINPPPGCRFVPRCRERIQECAEIRPKLINLTPDHQVACLRC